MDHIRRPIKNETVEILNTVVYIIFFPCLSWFSFLPNAQMNDICEAKCVEKMEGDQNVFFNKYNFCVYFFIGLFMEKIFEKGIDALTFKNLYYF